MAVKRVYLKDMHRMMDGMGVGFRDEWQVDDYMDA